MSENTDTPADGTVVNDQGEVTATTSYLDGKYKSVGELENGYKELQTSYSKKTAEYNDKMGAFAGAPEEYTLDEGVELNDGLLSWAKENNFSNEALNDFVKTQQEANTQQIETFQKEEMVKLGDNGQERIKNVVDYMKANTPITDDGLKQINDGLFGANGVEVLEALIKGNKQQSPATTQTAPTIDKDRLDYMQFQEKDSFGNRRYGSDPEFRQKVLNLRANLINK